MDVRPRVIPVCDDRCGCPTPCPGGQGCRCVTSSGGVGREEHTYCPCGEHCGCNPCTCKTTESGGVGKAFCKCGESCTCATCAG